MGGCRCSYKNCPNTTKTRENLHFFHYPVKQKERCRIWIENANKPQFYDLDEDQLKNKVICETHFEDYYFSNIQKKRLLQGAIPTLDGDCKPVVEDNYNRSGNKEEVQVRPANDDGTIFILETNNLQQNFESQRIESYIYTNNGLVLPLDKCNGEVHDMYQVDDDLSNKGRYERDEISNSSETDSQFDQTNNFLFNNHQLNNRQQPQQQQHKQEEEQHQELEQQHENQQVADKLITKTTELKTMNNKFVKKIKQHSKDIAILKRMLKAQRNPRRPNMLSIVNALRRQVPSTLSTVVNLHLNLKFDLTNDDLEFFTTIYNTSPQLYEMLIDKYNWKLPSYDTLKELINGSTEESKMCTEEEATN